MPLPQAVDVASFAVPVASMITQPIDQSVARAVVDLAVAVIVAQPDVR